VSDVPGDEAALPEPLARGAREPWPSFLRAFGWIGLNSFGGPVAQLGVVHEELCDKRAWLSEQQLLQVIAFANLLPGPEALEVIIHLGAVRRGRLGGVVAGLLFVWPGVAAMLALGALYAAFGPDPHVVGLFAGIRPVAAALIAAAMVRLAGRSIRGFAALALAAGALAASWLGVAFPLVLLGCGLAGALLRPRGAAAAGRPAARGVRASMLALGLVTLVGSFVLPRAASAPAAVAARAAAASPRAPATALQVAWLCTRTSLLTFGGAYTSLPYLREQAVERHHWLGDAQVVDALALGETTPGPLISVAIFVAYTAAGPVGGLLGALGLFAPTFLLVLALMPFAARVTHLPRLAGVLAGVAAGTLGLIAALSARVLPTVVSGWFEAAIALAAFVAVAPFWVKSRVSPLWVVGAGAILGLSRALL